MIHNQDRNRIRTAAVNLDNFDTFVQVTLNEAIECDPIQFMELLSIRATETDAMVIHDYSVVDFKGDRDSTLIVAVSGDVSAVPAAWPDDEG